METESIDKQIVDEKSAQSGIGTSRLDVLIAVFLFFLAVAEGLHTIHQVGISWDEPNYYNVVKGYIDWADNLEFSNSFSADTLEKVFGFKPKANDHPTLTKLIGAAACKMFGGMLGGFWAYRMSAPILFGLLLAIVYLRSAKTWGRPAALIAILSIVCTPSLFTHNHIAATDAPLCVFWLIAVCCFEAACKNRKWILLSGIAYGLVMSVKFTGFLFPVPVFIWGIIYRRKTMLTPFLAMLIIGPIVFLLLQPSMWDHPLWDLYRFIQSSVTRSEWNKLWVLFLGKIYNFSAPWYYAPFLIIVTTPEVEFLCFLVGGAALAKDKFKDEFAALCLLNFAFFIAVTFSPNAPTYDGTRLFLPAFLFLALLSGFGFRYVSVVLQKAGEGGSPLKIRFPKMIQAGLIAIVLFGLIPPFMAIYPYGLEYYNGFIGGIDGARKKGMETTFWWTILNEDAFEKINKTLPQNATLRFCPMDTGMWKLFIESGLIRSDIKITNGKEFDFAFVMSRPYWNYAPLIKYLGVPMSRLEAVDSLEVDGVPFWVLYKNKNIP